MKGGFATRPYASGNNRGGHAQEPAVALGGDAQGTVRCLAQRGEGAYLDEDGVLLERAPPGAHDPAPRDDGGVEHAATGVQRFRTRRVEGGAAIPVAEQVLVEAGQQVERR